MKAARIAGALLLVAPAVFAGVIRLDVAVMSHANAEETSVLVVLQNSGDEAAREVRVEGVLAGLARTNAPVDLAPEASSEAEMIFPSSALPPGLHMAEFRVRYRDGNGYPFSTVAVRPVQAGAAPGPARVSATLVPAVLTDTGRLRARLWLQAGASPATVSLRLLVADDLACDMPDRTVALFPGRPVMVEAALSNRTGRAGSVYPVFIIVTEAGRGPVREMAARGVITLERGGATAFPWPGLAFAVAMILALLFVIAQAGGKGRRSRET